MKNDSKTPEAIIDLVRAHKNTSDQLSTLDSLNEPLERIYEILNKPDPLIPSEALELTTLHRTVEHAVVPGLVPTSMVELTSRTSDIGVLFDGVTSIFNTINRIQANNSPLAGDDFTRVRTQLTQLQDQEIFSQDITDIITRLGNTLDKQGGNALGGDFLRSFTADVTKLYGLCNLQSLKDDLSANYATLQENHTNKHALYSARTLDSLLGNGGIPHVIFNDGKYHPCAYAVAFHGKDNVVARYEDAGIDVVLDNKIIEQANQFKETLLADIDDNTAMLSKLNTTDLDYELEEVLDNSVNEISNDTDTESVASLSDDDITFDQASSPIDTFANSLDICNKASQLAKDYLQAEFSRAQEQFKKLENTDNLGISENGVMLTKADITAKYEGAINKFKESIETIKADETYKIVEEYNLAKATNTAALHSAEERSRGFANAKKANGKIPLTYTECIKFANQTVKLTRLSDLQARMNETNIWFNKKIPGDTVVTYEINVSSEGRSLLNIEEEGFKKLPERLQLIAELTLCLFNDEDKELQKSTKSNLTLSGDIEKYNVANPGKKLTFADLPEVLKVHMSFTDRVLNNVGLASDSEINSENLGKVLKESRTIQMNNMAVGLETDIEILKEEQLSLEQPANKPTDIDFNRYNNLSQEITMFELGYKVQQETCDAVLSLYDQYHESSSNLSSYKNALKYADGNTYQNLLNTVSKALGKFRNLFSSILDNFSVIKTSQRTNFFSTFIELLRRNDINNGPDNVVRSLVKTGLREQLCKTRLIDFHMFDDFWGGADNNRLEKLVDIVMTSRNSGLAYNAIHISIHQRGGNLALVANDFELPDIEAKYAELIRENKRDGDLDLQDKDLALNDTEGKENLSINPLSHQNYRDLPKFVEKDKNVITLRPAATKSSLKKLLGAFRKSADEKNAALFKQLQKKIDAKLPKGNNPADTTTNARKPGKNQN